LAFTKSTDIRSDAKAELHLLAGRRSAVSLVMVAGEAVFGEASLLKPLQEHIAPLRVDGQPRAMVEAWARRTGARLRAHEAVRGLSWTAGLEIE